MDSLTPWWRPWLIVNGQPHTRLPRTMFLVLTPTRVLITDTKRGTTGYRPVLGSPILTLLRGDAEMTAQLREFSVTQPANPASGLTAPA